MSYQSTLHIIYYNSSKPSGTNNRHASFGTPFAWPLCPRLLALFMGALGHNLSHHHLDALACPFIEKICIAQVAYFVNSGSEANDMAMLMARLYTGNYDVLALRNCYHGMSEGTMGVTAHSTWKFNVPQVKRSPLGSVRRLEVWYPGLP